MREGKVSNYEGVTVSNQRTKSRGTHQFDKRYFRQNWFIWFLFCISSGLSLSVLAVLDEVEFEHFADGGRRHHILTRDQQCDHRRDSGVACSGTLPVVTSLPQSHIRL